MKEREQEQRTARPLQGSSPSADLLSHECPSEGRRPYLRPQTEMFKAEPCQPLFGASTATFTGTHVDPTADWFGGTHRSSFADFFTGTHWGSNSGELGGTHGGSTSGEYGGTHAGGTAGEYGGTHIGATFSD